MFYVVSDAATLVAERPGRGEGIIAQMKLGFSAWAMREVPVDRQMEIVRAAERAWGVPLVHR